MKNAQKPDHISLNTLINWLREGRFSVPDFQREFEWKPWDIDHVVDPFLENEQLAPGCGGVFVGQSNPLVQFAQKFIGFHVERILP